MGIIGIGADHAAFPFKEELKEYLVSQGYTVQDFGTTSTQRTDYGLYAFAVAEAVAAGTCERGILCCGTGLGMCIAANKVKGIRAVVCSEPVSARLSREHNNANVLTLGARIIGLEMAKSIVDTWLTTDFAGGRHAQRLAQIAAYENK